MNRKILDLIVEIQSLQNQLKSLDSVRELEEKTSRERLAATLAKNGIIHIQCDHNSVQAAEHTENNFCQYCKNRVVFTYGTNLTEDEMNIVSSVYKKNTKVGQLEEQMQQLYLKFQPIIDKIDVQIINDMKKADMALSKCTHEDAKMYERSNSGFCTRCNKGVHKTHDILINEDEVNMMQRIANTLPVNMKTSGYDWRHWFKQ